MLENVAVVAAVLLQPMAITPASIGLINEIIIHLGFLQRFALAPFAAVAEAALKFA